MFRAAVKDFQQAQWMGTIRVARYPGFSVVAALAVGLAAALIAFALIGQISRKARVPGLLMPVGGLMHLAAHQAGQVQAVLVGEGEQVRSGQLLIRLRSERMLATGDVAALNARAMETRRASLDTERRLQLRQAEERRQSLRDRLRSLDTEAAQAREELDMVRQRVELAQRSRSRFIALAAEGYVSATQSQQKDEELLDLRGRERSAQRALENLMREAQTLTAELGSIATTVETSLTQLDRGLAQLAQESAELEARAGLEVVAPRDGRVSALPLHPGQAVQAGQTLLTLTPDDTATGSGGPAPLIAQLYAPSRTVGFVQPGQAVWLRYGAYPFQKFGMAKGRVARVSPTPIAPQDLPAGQGQALVAAAQANEPLYRIDVHLERQAIAAYGRDVPLRAGMALDADVSLEHRRIWEWLLEPLLATAKRI